jgi:LacI family transcriptional regulator
MNSTKNVTLQDIAKVLKLSKVSVSKALRDHPDISIKTKALVKKTAERLGYTPNFIARNLSSRQSKTIGLVVPKIAHHFFASAIESIYQTAFENNYEIIMTVSQEKVENELIHLNTLLSMRVDGLLVSVTEETRDRSIFHAIKKRGIPLVFFDRVINGIGFSTVTIDDEMGSYNAISEIIASGYTEIAHLGGFDYISIGTERRAGFERAMKEHGLKGRKSWNVEGGFSEQDGYHGFLKIFKSGELPEVIFAVTYPVALGVVLAAQETGINVPEELQVVSFGGSIFNRFASPSLSYIDQPAEEIGKKATELLLEEIKNPELYEEQHIIIPTQLVICDTCKKKKGVGNNGRL